MFALVVFRAPLFAMARSGFVNTIGEDPMRGAVAWFVLFGGALAMAALAIDALEARGAPLRGMGLGMLALVVLGIAWMPASGFWLALPAIFVMVRRREVVE